MGDFALVIVLLAFIEFKVLRGRATAIKMPLQGASLLALGRLDRLMGHLGVQLKRDRLLHTVASGQDLLVRAVELLLLSGSGGILWHRQLALPPQRAILLLYELFSRWVGRAIEKRLAIDCPSLLELLLHLIGDHLLAEADLPQMHRAIVIVLLLPIAIFGIMVIMMVLLLYIVDETALMVVVTSCGSGVVIVLALERAPHIVTRSPSRIVFGARLRHLFLLLVGGRGLLWRQNLLLLELFTALDGMVEKVLLVMPSTTTVVLQEGGLGGV